MFQVLTDLKCSVNIFHCVVPVLKAFSLQRLAKLLLVQLSAPLLSQSFLNFLKKSTVYRSVGLPPVGLCRCTSNASDKYARCHGWGVAANIWAKAVEAAVVYLLHEPEHLQRDARLPRHLVTKLVVLAHEVDRKGVVVLATEHIGAAGLPEEGVAGRHADGVPEVHKINPTSFGCPESAEFSRE